jgi:dolichol-phosphate mannosyltransferase
MSNRATTVGEGLSVRDRSEGTPTDRRLISIVTPAFNEAQNLPVLYERLRATMDALEEAWEWVIVDDHSRDDTFAVITALSERDPRVHGLRFTRNFGAHTALMCALHHARGHCVANLAGDLQDPPEVIPLLVERWKAGAKVVWAARDSREGETATTIGFARLYYWVMRHVVGLKDMPPTGADLFLADGTVIDAFSRFNEGNASIQGLITWMGFEQVTIGYDKAPRLHGSSGWSLRKKLKLLVDSVTSFSYVPIRFMSYFGFLLGILGFFYAGFVILNRLHGHPIEGWSSLVVVVLFVGGVQMVMMGVLGEYLWRALDESRRRPRYIIEATTASRSTSQVE